MPRHRARGSLVGTGFAIYLACIACWNQSLTLAEDTTVQAATTTAEEPSAAKADLTTLYEERSVSVADGNAQRSSSAIDCSVRRPSPRMDAMATGIRS
jgi:hypothetical protein